MSALVFDGAEHEGNGVAAVREAMDLGYRVALRQLLALEKVAPVVTDDAIYSVFAPEFGLVTVTRYDLPAELKRFVGEQLRAAGFKSKRYEDGSRYELWVDAGEPPKGRLRQNPSARTAPAAVRVYRNPAPRRRRRR